MFHRHHFSAEHHLIYLLWDLIIKSFQCRDDTKCRHRPDQGGHFTFTQKIQKLHRKGKILFGYHLHRCPALQSWINILHRNIKIPGRLIPDYILRTNSKDLRKTLNKINHTPVTDHNPLRNSRRTRSKNPIQRINIKRLLPNSPKHRFLNLFLLQFFQL